MNKTRTIPVVSSSGPNGKQLLQTIKGSQAKRDKSICAKVQKVIDDVRLRGDDALVKYAETFDKIKLSAAKMRLTQKELAARAKMASPELKAAINEAAKRIESYHRKQLRNGFKMKTDEGTLRFLIRPLSRVGVYIPGGHTVYPSSVLMNVIPAQVAGVKEIAAVTPPRQELDPGVAYALQLLGITEVYRAGGATGDCGSCLWNKNYKSGG